MRVAYTSSSDMSVQQSKISTSSHSSDISKPSLKENHLIKQTNQEIPTFDAKEKEAKVDKAIQSLNELLEINQKSSKFIKHEGLDKYFVRLVDSETEEVIKEIPPEKLLNAFYEMQKLLGMIVDEKI